MTARQKQALAALLLCPSVERAAASVSMSPQTIRRWMREDSTFRREHEQQLQELVTDAAAQLKKNMGEAVQVMADVMNDETVNPQVRLNASDALLRQSLKFIEAVDILERLEKIEGRLSADGVD